MADVDWNKDGSCWAAIGGGRKRWFPPKHRVTLALKQSLTLDKLEIESTDVLKGGYYQKTVYYRDEEGKICIPPDPAMAPKGVELLTVKSIREATRLQKEMTEQEREKFSGDAQATRYFDEAQGEPMRHLEEIYKNPKSNFERDMVSLMIDDLRQEERDRENIQAETTLHWLGT